MDAQIIFGSAINELYEKIVTCKDTIKAVNLIDQFLCRKIIRARRQNRACILASLAALNKGAGSTSIKDLQQITHTSPKTLERAFKTEIGMTPKMFQRLLRFNQAKRYIQRKKPVDWWDVAVRFGFSDHSHLISEFQAFAGVSPSTYINTLLYYDEQEI